MAHGELPELIASAARDLQDQAGSQNTMDKVVELAVELVAGAEHAGISMVHAGGRIDSPAVSDEVVGRVDALQYEHGHGPCVDAIREQEPVVHSPNIAVDARWPEWGPRTTAETGIRSMLSFRLFTTGNNVGALNLYSRREGAFQADDHEAGIALTAHAAVAMVAAREIESLHVAVDGRTVIGQAAGILMERFDVRADVAFGVLKRVSQESNRKLRDIAQELVTTRETPK